MHEALLHYIWKNSLIESNEFVADTGEHIGIIQTGISNSNEGPDFTNALIEVDNTTWAGNVEIHTQASDWYKHNHHSNPVYNNVILHVVARNDQVCYNSDGRKIPCITLATDSYIENRYYELIHSKNPVPCSSYVAGIDPIKKSFWLSSLAVERMEKKTKFVGELLHQTKNNWEETLYIMLARGFGLKINVLPFEILAKSVTMKTINASPGNIFRTEAILFGQAGFLDDEPVDDYQRKLEEEYRYQKKKYNLTPLDRHFWKFLRLRPLNFPTIRIAQFGNLISKHTSLLLVVLACKNLVEMKTVLNCGVSEYWNTHYTFGSTSAFRKKNVGMNTLHTIIINSIVPLMFVYGKMKNRAELTDRAVQLLEQLSPEQNRIVQTWKRLGYEVHNAAESQGLIELAGEYCSKKRCLECRIGHILLSVKRIDKPG